MGIRSVSPTSPRAKAALLIVSSLICGIVIGVAGDHAYLLWRHRLIPSHRMAEAVSQRIVKHLDDELHFTPAQRTEIQQIIDRHRQRIEAIWANVRPQARQEIDQTNAEIERVLTPDQLGKFRTMRMRMQQQHERRGINRRPPI